MSNSEPKPWTPITDSRQLRYLGKLLEELGELTAAVSRCIIQGIDEKEPVTGKLNRTWLEEELADVEACMSTVAHELNLDQVKIGSRYSFKRTKLVKWLDLAASTTDASTKRNEM
jgi:NTP pyrophosphatase (non-canonical NTP hydrolase)